MFNFAKNFRVNSIVLIKKKDYEKDYDDCCHDGSYN